MKEVRGCLVFGKVSFSKGCMEGISFKDFEKNFGDKLQGFNLKEAYKALGGKLSTPKKSEEKQDK